MLVTGILVNFSSGAQHLLWFVATAAGTALVHALIVANEKASVGLFRLLSVLKHQVRQNTPRVPWLLAGELVKVSLPHA